MLDVKLFHKPHQLFFRYERWESRIRDHLVIEGLLMLTLFGIFVTYIRLDSRNEETQFMIRNLQDEFITFQKNVLGKDFSGLKTKTETDNKKIEEMLIQVLKEVEVKPVIVAENIEKLNVLTETDHSKSASTPPNITTLQAQFDKFQKQVSGKEIIDSKNQSETESQKKEVKKMEDVLNEVLREVEFKPVELADNTPKPTIPIHSSMRHQRSMMLW
ncbi:hypothetical protein CAEBREN_05928 [Caenorhabditis brenneri]|uniref:Uncharacterized protein n=1 Tax=Caenorhabditis brenneri TaxID=135651 RepID=G0NG29_CAEBE|nr:hypothetical protein CAEBREN_05928 [Caenorhabditis brenneri]